MKKYMALYIADTEELASMMKDSSQEESKKGMEMWNTWVEEHKDVLVDEGTPLGKTKTVTKDGTIDTKNGNLGYTIVHADSLDAAAKIFEGHPHVTMMPNVNKMPSSRIDVMECVDMEDWEV